MQDGQPPLLICEMNVGGIVILISTYCTIKVLCIPAEQSLDWQHCHQIAYIYPHRASPRLATLSSDSLYLSPQSKP